MSCSRWMGLALCWVLAIASGRAGESEARKTAATVTVDAATALGPSAARDLLGVNWVGAGEDEPNLSTDWARRAGLKYHRASADYVGVTRMPQCTGIKGQCLEFDFSPLEAAISRQLKLPTFPMLMGFTQIPKALSSRPNKAEPLNHSSHYSPMHWEEWAEYVRRTVRHLVDRWSLKGLYYEVWNEPEDHTYFWKGTLGEKDLVRAYHSATRTDYWKIASGKPETLPEYIKLYATTAKAIKEGDPTAQVGGPASSHWDNLRHTTDPPEYKLWGLPEFLRALKKYEDSTGQDVPLDFIVWHDYCWASTRISDGADFIDGLVAELGFSPKPAYIISEWNREWGFACGHYTLLQHASHAAYNLIRELDPERRRLAQMYWFAFDLDGSCPNTALTTGTVSQRVLAQHSAAPAAECRRPAYAVFEMIKTMQSGEYLRTTADDPLVALAVRDRRTITATVNNNTDSEVQTILRFANLPAANKSARSTIRRIDESHSSNCRGLEQGVSRVVRVQQNTAEVELTLRPYATTQISLNH